MSNLVDVYPYCKVENEWKLLLFKRAEDVIYPGQWRMIGGKVEEQETAAEAAFREFREETGIIPKLFWVIPSINQFYDHQSDTIKQIPAFAAEVGTDTDIILNHEHVDYSLIRPKEIENYALWPEQERLFKLVSTIVTQNKILKEWIL